MGRLNADFDMPSVNDQVLVEAPVVVYLSVKMGEILNHNGSGILNMTSLDEDKFGSLEDIDVTADGTPILRIVISVVYSVVCAVGLVGNLLVFFLMRLRQGRKKSSINR